MVFFNKGERVWASSKDLGWVLGTVVAQEAQTVTVKLDTGEEQKFPEGKLIQFVAESLHDFDDMVRINDLNEPVLLNNLKQRYAADKIYTLIGPVLVSMNPYKTLPIYSRQIMKDYSATRPGDPKNTRPPHIFSIANNAYRSLLSNRLNQSVVISGESGAGKTEATKFVLQYLAYVSDPLSTGKVEQQILESSPILEAFGNAKTIRNNNSSRFGKFTKITFDQRGHISGAEITNYLLEKSRIPYHAPNERNYHVFYQLCRGASADEKRALDLQAAESYVYLNKGQAVSIPGVDDAADYRRLRNAMTILGLSQAEQLDIFRVLSAILHLGNLTFEPKQIAQKEEWRVKDRQLLGVTAKLLGTDPDRLEMAFVRRSFQASASRKSTYAIQLNQKQAEESRDALSKTLYGILFDWLVDRVNQPLKPPNTDDLFIGVLDIFGFEIFEQNSFEQVLINLTNEKILQLFNQHMFKSEQAEYQAEGINWSQVAFKDNQEVIDMVEKRPVGILHLLDEECVLPNGNEKALLDKMTSNHQNNKFFYKKRTHPNLFGIKHYAGDVDYDITGMMDKNRDTLFPDLEGLMKDSQCAFIAALFNKNTMPPPAAAAAPTTTPTTTAPAGPMSAGAKWAANQSASTGSSAIGALGASTIQRGKGAPAAAADPSMNGLGGTIKRGPGAAGAGVPASAAMMPTLKREAKTGGRASVSAQFREQLTHLSSILSNTNVHYIWCIKPNTAQRPNSLDELYLLNQMRCTGIMETIKIRKQGFAARKPFEEFVHRYKILFARGTVFTKQNAKTLALQFLQYYAADTPDQWQVGKTKIFLRERQLFLLDVQREEQLGAVANTIIHFMRGYVARQKYLRAKAERERKRREEAERRRREEEERRRREEEERRRREEAERLRREEEERRRQAEELRRRQEEEERRRRAEEERRYREEEEKRRRDEEERRRAEEDRRRQEDEQRRQALANARARQEEEQRRRQEEEERRRAAAAAAQAHADEEAAALRQRQREEERRKILAAQAALPPAPSMTLPPPPVIPAPTPAPVAAAPESLNPAELARRQREQELAKKREELEKRRADLQRRKEDEERKRRELEMRIEDHQPAVAKAPARPMSNFVPETPVTPQFGGSYIGPRSISSYTPDAPPSGMSGGAAPTKPTPFRLPSNYANDTPGSPSTPNGASRLAGRQMAAPPAPPAEEPATYSLSNLPPPPAMIAPPPPVFFEPPPAVPTAPVPEDPPTNGYRNFYTSMPNVPVVGSGMVDLKIGSSPTPKQQVAPSSPQRVPIEDYPSMSPGRSSPLDSRIVSSPADKLLANSGKGTSYQNPSPLTQSSEGVGRGRTGTTSNNNGVVTMSALDFLSAISNTPESPQTNTPLSPNGMSTVKRDKAETMMPQGTVKRGDPPKNGLAPNPYDESTDLWFRFNIINEVISTEREYVRDIMLLIEIYLQPLRASSLVTASEIQSLFSNVELLVNLNKQLLNELEKSQYPYENIMIGQIFLKLSEYFKMYKVYCLSEDMQILTEHGFMFLDEMLSAGPNLRVAAYNDATKTFAYEQLQQPPIVNPRAAQRMIEFTQADEARRWDPARSNEGHTVTPAAAGPRAEHTKEKRQYSNHVSLVVTPEHDMFVRLGRHVGKNNRWSDTTFCKRTAGDLLAHAATAPHDTAIKMLTIAANGIAPAAVAGAAAAGVIPGAPVPPTKEPLFLELLGYWLGDGSLRQGGAVQFDTTKPQDMAFLRQTFDELAIPFTEYGPLGPANAQRFRISSGPFRDLILNEYGHKYGYGPYAGARRLYDKVSTLAGSFMEPEEVDSAKWLPWWTWRLGRTHARRLLRGLRRADGSEAVDLNQIWTSSVRFRDELVRFCFHAGYAAHFQLMYAVGTYRGVDIWGEDIIATADSWSIFFSDYVKVAEPVLRYNEKRHDVKEVENYVGRTWCVSVSTGLIVTRRAAVKPGHPNIVTKATVPQIVGNCANHPTSIQVYEAVIKSNPKFVKFVEQASQDIRCRGLMLSSFLIKPVQRVLKYPLLLKELRKYTKADHPDSTSLVAAQAKIDELAAALNESQRLAEGLQKIVDLQNSIEDCGELVTPTRRLLKDAPFIVRPDSVNEKPSERHVFLFNDLILIAAKYKSFAKKAIQWQSRAQIFIADCKIIFIAEDTLNHTFGLESTVGRKTYTYILTAPDAAVKKEWFDLLKDLKKQAQIKDLKAIAPKKIIIPEQFTAQPTGVKKR